MFSNECTEYSVINVLATIDDPTKAPDTIIIIIIGAAVGGVVVLLLIITAVLIKRRRRAGVTQDQKITTSTECVDLLRQF